MTQMIWYRVGSADETPGKSGLAHFLEHLMFKGTAKHPAGEFSQTVRHRRPRERFHLDRLYRLFPARAARPARRMMEFEADRMTGLILKDEMFCPSATSCSRNTTCGSPTTRPPG